MPEHLEVDFVLSKSGEKQKFLTQTHTQKKKKTTHTQS